VLGRHDGVHHFTLGQRHGLGVAAAEPLYVIGIDPSTSEVRVGARAVLQDTLRPAGCCGNPSPGRSQGGASCIQM
jgi:tRNA U34 2-thiouridine synthase MnmA/TrmU